MKSIWMGLIVMILAMAILACQPSAPTSPSSPQAQPATSTPAEGDTTEIPTVTFAPTQESEPQPDPALPIPALASLPRLIEIAKEDLAQRLQTSISQINVREAREVFWADASLGCPQPDTTYNQVQTPGYLVLLETDGNEYEYHASIHNYVFYCENPTPPIMETPGSVPLPP